MKVDKIKEADKSEKDWMEKVALRECVTRKRECGKWQIYDQNWAEFHKIY